MSRKFLGLLVLLLCCASLLTASVWVSRTRHRAPHKVHAPHAVIEPIRQRAVAAPGSQQIRTTFTIRNQGSEPLTLGDPVPTCGCTIAALQPRALAAGASAELVIEGTAPPAGEKNVSIVVPLIESHESLRAQLILVGSATPPFVTASSGDIAYGLVDGPSSEETFWVETREVKGSAPGLADVRSKAPEIQIQGGLTREMSVGDHAVARHYGYSVRLVGEFEPGEYGRSILLGKAGATNSFTHAFEVRWSRHPAVYAIPQRLYMNSRSGGVPPTLALYFASSVARGSLIIEPDTKSCESFTFAPRGVDPNRPGFSVTPKDSLRETTTTQLIFHTNDERAPTILVPVYCRVDHAPTRGAEPQ